MDFALRQYSLPLLLALLLHGLALSALYSNWNPTTTERQVIQPRAVQASLLMMEPKARPAPPQPVTQPPAPKPDPAVEQRRVAEEAARKQAAEDAARKQAADRAAEQKAAEDRDRAEARDAQERQQRLDALAQSSFQDALQSEASELAALDAQADADAAQSYRQGIYQAVVANWSRPPSARNGMQAKLLVELVPTGDVVAVTVVESSGNSAFDRSAEAAVRKARRFEVPKEPEVFEAYFRRFTLLFRPEDLLR